MTETSSLWETIIGLEIHVELNTKSKLFSKAPNHFGDEPNSNITEVCTGQPGALPVLNKEAVKKAVQFGLSIGSQINLISTFDRKSYFYPDSPRNFQITQYENPIVAKGTVQAVVEGEVKSFAVHHAHLEDDAGMLKHFSQFAGVDYNRAGVPLLEIVSEPCMHSAKEASAYAQAIKAIMEYIDASDCNMEEGSLRIDVNVSVRQRGERGLRNKVEIKNMNSFSNMELAIEAEVKRQVKAYLQNEEVEQATFRFDPERRETILMRRKEGAEDYRYFPEPDLLPIVLDEKEVQSWKEALPELPFEKNKRYVQELSLSQYAADLLTSNRKLALFFEEGLKHCPNAAALCNWITVEFMGRFKDTGDTLESVGITSLHLSKLVNMIDKGRITGKIAKSVADDMVASKGKDPEEIVQANPDYQPLHDESAIGQLVDQVIQENQSSVQDFKAGKERAFGFLVGQVMKVSRGKASPAIVNDLLKKKLEKI